jgi:hypothetical protein
MEPLHRLSRCASPPIRVSDLRGKPVILAFYLEPGLWRPDDALQRRYSRSSARTTRNYWAFRSTGCGAMLPSPVTVTCISRCSPISKPKGDVGRKYRAYRAYRASEGVCERALFVLDRQGIIAWSYCSPIAVNPSADGIPDALEKLSDQAKSHSQLENADHAGGVRRLRMQHCSLAHPVVN